MVVEIHEDQPLPAPGGMSTAIVEAVGTTGTVNAPAAWGLMPEMTLIVACNAGDQLLINWTGNLYINALNRGEARICVNGAPISMTYMIGEQSAVSAAALRSVYGVTKSYTAPAAANYTVTLEWRAPIGGIVRCYNQERCLTVARFY